jgi:hypothetical protein
MIALYLPDILLRALPPQASIIDELHHASLVMPYAYLYNYFCLKWLIPTLSRPRVKTENIFNVPYVLATYHPSTVAISTLGTIHPSLLLELYTYMSRAEA